LIYHITSRTKWKDAQTSAEYTAPGFESEGFIHCATKEQVLPVANAFYRGQKALVLLMIEEAKLEAELKWEAPAGPPTPGISESDSFPHIYGAINLSAVVSVLDLLPDSAGNFILPSLT